MKNHLLTAFFVTIFCVPFQRVLAGNGGDVVRNGGGLSEQAILYSSLHYRSFSARCLQNAGCSSSIELQTALKKVQTCSLPGANDFRFQTPQENAALQGKIYVRDSEGVFRVNREELYKPNPLSFPAAMAFLSRIYFDSCHTIPWSHSKEMVAPLEALAEYDGEQITVGKDSIRLPQAEWIRVRSLFSDLLIETPIEMISLSCENQSLTRCGVSGTLKAVNTEDRFKYLSLANEEIKGDGVVFIIEGHYQPAQKRSEFFDMQVIVQKGKVMNIQWMGQAIKIPRD